VSDSLQLTAAWQSKLRDRHRRPATGVRYFQIASTTACSGPRHRLCAFAVVQRFLPADFAPCINHCSTLAEASCSIDITVTGLRRRRSLYLRSSRWTKDDLRSIVELCTVAVVGAVAAWLIGKGVLLGVAAALILFWLVLGVACLWEVLSCRYSRTEGLRHDLAKAGNI
jgi:hypothetical protein